MLGEVAQAIARSPGTYLHGQYQPIARRRGKHKALMAVAHSALVIAYHMLKDKRPYTDLGADYFDQLDTARLQRHAYDRDPQRPGWYALLPGQDYAVPPRTDAAGEA